jgi:hypothetical protein
MAPKAKKKQEQSSKKNEQKKKQQAIQDKTFGLKNKNKSKKVQQQVDGIAKGIMNSGDPRQKRQEEQRKKIKADAKLRKKAADDERNVLFGEALLAVKTKKTIDQKSGKMEAKGRDGNEENVKKGTSRAMKMMYQMDAQEMEDRLKEDVSSCALLRVYLRVSYYGPSSCVQIHIQYILTLHLLLL